jgi:hypothetical protein
MYNRPSISGPYAARLTKADIQQITELAFAHRNILRPVNSIEAKHLDEITADSGSTSLHLNKQTTFRAQKRDGKWRVIENSVEETALITTD